VTSGKNTAKDEDEETGKARSFAKLRMTAQRAPRGTRGSIDSYDRSWHVIENKRYVGITDK
jgi:hypothetical protein